MIVLNKKIFSIILGFGLQMKNIPKWGSCVIIFNQNAELPHLRIFLKIWKFKKSGKTASYGLEGIYSKVRKSPN